MEELFGEAKEYLGLGRMKFRGTVFVREQVLLTAAAQNIKRMARLLPRRGLATQAKLLQLPIRAPSALYDLMIYSVAHISGQFLNPVEVTT
jgi:hypothetical protein